MADREEVERLVQGLEYPISKRALLEAARQAGVSPTVMAAVERLHDDVFAGHAALVSDLEQALRTGQ